MNTTIPLIIKTRWVNAGQNKNKIIYTTESYSKQMIAHVIISSTLMLQVSVDICLLLPWPT